ncbi:MAG: FtsQ-type POTRA domain-containing protein, partial [Mesorhizobium sp.]
ITARTGFAVDQVKVVGNRQTSEIDILDRLELDGWTSLIGFNAEAARERIATLPWIEVAAVRKVYPHTLEVRVEEREAFALWQQGDALSVIERNGAMIAPFSGGK